MTALDKYSALGATRKLRRQGEAIDLLRKSGNFLTLLITTIVSCLLVASDQSQWSVSGNAYDTLNKYRTSVQIAVQVISASFGFLQQNVVCQLFNYATRLRFRKKPPTLDAVYAWNSISAARPGWGLRTRFLLPTIIFTVATLVPSALWAGAITPALIVTQVPSLGPLPVPQFQISTMVREWPAEIGLSGPLLRTTMVGRMVWGHLLGLREIHAFRYGSGIFIYLTFAINTAILLLLAEEVLRTRVWKDLLYSDYMDPHSFIVGVSMGGCAIALVAKIAWTDRTRPMYKYDSMEIGSIRVALHENHKSIVLDTSRSQQKELPAILNLDE